MSRGSHDCRKHCRGCGHIVDLVAGECPVCEYVHYVDEKKNDVEPQQVPVSELNLWIGGIKVLSLKGLVKGKVE